ncbi:helix-turn-helix domain-containing protein [Phytomonospora sp. NPDC050363]|uniref:TetR/AcrR family transcriptional regulator n=1 Tax=Phytomonospora sp. NPDC050363 TaxID=3155642 RepID=UPI0033CCA44E
MTQRGEGKKRATRRAIQEAAVRLAVQHGVDGVSVEAISAAAGIARSTFFTHFKSKEDALTPEAPWSAAELAEAVAARPSRESAPAAVAEVLAGAARRLDADPAANRSWPEFFARNPGFVPPHNAELTEVLVEAVTPRAGDRDEAELAVAVAMAVFWTVRRQAARDGAALEPRLRRALARRLPSTKEKS